MKLTRETPKKARIEMLPLIDIVFLLLVFFIYAMISMAVHRGLPVNLPTSTTVKVDKKLVLSVTVSADGSIHLDKDPVAMEDLSAALMQKSGGDTGTGVLFFADRTLSYQRLFDILDAISTAGLHRISLQAEVE